VPAVEQVRVRLIVCLPLRFHHRPLIALALVMMWIPASVRGQIFAEAEPSEDSTRYHEPPPGMFANDHPRRVSFSGGRQGCQAISKGLSRALLPRPLWPYGYDPLWPDESQGDRHHRPMLLPSPWQNIRSDDAKSNKELSRESPTEKNSVTVDGKHGEIKTERQKKDTIKPTANITAQLQSDFAWFAQSAKNAETVGDIPDGAFFRRARIGVYGELSSTFEYRIEFEFAGAGRPRFLDVWLAMTDLPYQSNLIVGHYFEPFSLERYTSNRFITFNERALSDNFAPARNMGFMAYGHSQDLNRIWAIGLFRTNSDLYGDHMSSRGGWAITAHGTYLPWFEEPDEYTRYLLHLGVSYSYRAADDELVRFSSRPSIRLRQQDVNEVPLFVDTGEIADAYGYQLIGLETAWVHGPFSIQGEWVGVPVRRGGGAKNPFFHGGYIYGSWFLTGESRHYSRGSALGRFQQGVFQRVIPKSNVFDQRVNGISGIGAWEIAARWAYITLNSAGVQGGAMDEVTLGVNWYLNPYTRVSTNFVYPMLRDPKDGESNAGMVSLRFQFEY